MPFSIGIKYLSYEQINCVAVECLKKFNPESKIPVPIEHVIDNILKINIIPFPSLFTGFEINAFTSSDNRNIYVDEYLYEYLNPQYRFTLAHELGHIVLHKEIYSKCKTDSIQEWKEFISEIDQFDYNRLEFQANCFAGLFLVPRNHLEKVFYSELKKQRKNIERAQSNGLKKEDYLPYIADLISEKLSPIFEVHKDVVRIRIEKDKLDSMIP